MFTLVLVILIVVSNRFILTDCPVEGKNYITYIED